jgi:hypothetical protein
MAQSPDEKSYVEIPFVEQLKGMEWQHLEGDIDVPYLTERESFRDVLLTKRAVQVNIEIMRAFVRVREMIASHRDLKQKLSKLEKKYDREGKK